MTEYILFPGSSSSWVPRLDKTKQEKSFINNVLLYGYNEIGEKVPYLELSNEKGLKSNKIIIYFHGNAENMYESCQIIEPIFELLNFTTYIMEYPGYSSYKRIKRKDETISQRINNNANEFINNVLQNQERKLVNEDIYIIGRSIGTGPASYLAEKIQNSKLVLISPFDSIKSLAYEKIGKLYYFVSDHFNNIEKVKNMKADLLIIHGEKDEVIDIKHAQNVEKAYNNEHKGKKCEFEKRSRMSHNKFDEEDVTMPIVKFLQKLH